MVVLVMFDYVTYKDSHRWVCDIFRIWFPGDSYMSTCLGTWNCITTLFKVDEEF